MQSFDFRRASTSTGAPLPDELDQQTLRLLQDRLGNQRVLAALQGAEPMDQLIREALALDQRGTTHPTLTSNAAMQDYMRQSTPEAQGEEQTQSFTLAIQLTGVFGGDLSATLTASGKSAEAKADGAARLTDVPVHPTITVTAKPSVPPPDDRYSNTSKDVEVKLPASPPTEEPIVVSHTLPLTVNRTNQKNVDDTWVKKGINPDLATQTQSTLLFDRKVTLNVVTVPKAEAVQNKLHSLNPDLQASILDSIFEIGGYNRRTTDNGSFSDHSIGCAVDINAFRPHRQNDQFKRDEQKDKKLFDLVNVVLKYAGSPIDIRSAQGNTVVEASYVFSISFKPWMLSIVGTIPGVLPAEKEQSADFFTAVNWKTLQAALPTLPAEQSAPLRTVLANQTVIHAWVDGLPINKDTVVKGMVPLHTSVIEIMTDCGWSWGGDWQRGDKDFMHFEDPQGEAALKKK